MRRGQLSDRRRRQRGQPDAADRAGGRERSHHQAQRVHAIQLVIAEGRDDECLGGLHAPGDDAEDVQCRGVGPVQVLKHDDRGRPLTQLVHQLGGEHVRPGFGPAESVELAAGRRGDVEEWRQRTRRDQRVACAVDHLDPGGQVRGEAVHQLGLAYTGLAGDEDQPSGAALDHLDVICQQRELGGAFEQLYLCPRLQSGLNRAVRVPGEQGRPVPPAALKLS